MAASAGNELDTVLGVGEERYEKVRRRWPPPQATSSTLCWESGRRDRENAAVAASAGNELDTVLVARVKRYEKVRRRPPPPATSLTLCWESGRRDTRSCCGGRLRRQRARHCAGSQGGEIREGEAVATSAGNVLDTVLGVGEERYEKLLRWSPPQATSSTLCWESGWRDTRR